MPFSSREQRKVDKYLLIDADIIYLKELDSKVSKLSMATLQLQKDSLTLAQCQEAVDFAREQVSLLKEVVTVNDDQSDEEDIDDEQKREHKRLKKELDGSVAAAGRRHLCHLCPQDMRTVDTLKGHQVQLSAWLV